nr:uncharacterized protein LOC116434705 isoform X2 [Nomia melanderi]
MSVSAVEILLNLKRFDVVLGMAVWLVGQEVHLFFLCLNGQRLSDFCENVYRDALECAWYTFSAKSKVIYRFLITNILTPRQLVAMKLIVLNMQTFQAVTRAVEYLEERRYNKFIQCLPAFLVMAISCTKYIHIMMNSGKVKELLAIIQSDTERCMKLPEKRIYHASVVTGKFYVTSSQVQTWLALIVYLMIPIVPMIQRARNHGNITEPPEFLYEVDYKVDHEKYFYLITAHTYHASLVTIGMVIALDIFYIVAIHHCCTLFEVTGFKLKTAYILDKSILKNGDEWKTVTVEKFSPEEEAQVFRNVSHSIVEHNRALEFLNTLQSMFSVELFSEISLHILCLSACAVEILIKRDNLDVAFRMLVWLVAVELHLFQVCIAGQRLSNYSENVYYDALECMWCFFDSKTKVIYRFFILNTLMPCQLVAFKLTVVNMETFLAVSRLAASYFTVLSSMI